MIDKVKVGKRIISLRKEHRFTQNDFADKLNVTPQAVSKWETGGALPDIEILLTMSALFNITINEILEGKNILYKIANRPFKMSNIAYFVPEEEHEYNVESAKELNMDISWEWKKNNKQNDKLNSIAKRIVEHGGLILELGAGPGGGLMPWILFEKHDANIIVSDISPTVVNEWKRIFDNDFFPPNICYAALDSCDLPFEDNSIDVISIGGFNNTVGDRVKAINEIYRVLKPGGMYVATDACVTKENLKLLPENVQKIMLEKIGFIFEDYYEATMAAGFKKIDNTVMGEGTTKGDRSTIADLAEELGVELTLTWYVRYCTK